MATRLRKPVPQLLDDLGVDYIVSGKNVKRGNVNVPCPFCRDDPSQHMGIGIDNGFWACWRNASHKGRNLAKLVMRLSRGLSYRRAKEMIYGESPTLEEHNMDDVASGNFWKEKEERKKLMVEAIRSLKLPRQFKKFISFNETGGRFSRRFANYLEARGFDDPYRAARYFGLRYALVGDYASRIVFPYYYHGKIVTWTARAVQSDAVVRYKALSAADSILPTKKCLYNYDRAWLAKNQRILAVVEGPIDAAKLHFYGKDVGLSAVALSSASISETQIGMLDTLLSETHYRVLLVICDQGAEAQAMAVGSQVVSVCRLRHVDGPFVCEARGAADPGDMTETQIIDMAMTYCP